MIDVKIADIEMVAIDELKPHPKNMNHHDKSQVERLAKILEYQGWRYPIKVSKRSGFITSGHGRLLAAQELGLKEVPVSYQDYVDDDQEYADIVADNSIASWAELDLSAINKELENFDPSFDLELLGIKDFVLDPAEIQNKSGELDINSFDNFQHECPKCGFEWNDNGTT